MYHLDIIIRFFKNIYIYDTEYFVLKQFIINLSAGYVISDLPTTIFHAYINLFRFDVT
jgi:hypothetical protein